MRKEFGKFIVEIAEKDSSVYLLIGDIGYRIFDLFREKFPKRFLNLGICEQSLIGIAAGMALEGLKPYVYTITPFLIERPFEQIKLDIDQQNVNVKLIGYADYPTQGPTHAEINGEKLMSLFSNIKSYFPKSSEETRKFLKESYEHQKPSFISLKKIRQNERKMEGKITKQELIDFEKEIEELWGQAKIPYPVHFSGGNEDQLMEIFKEINEGDYILSTHRSHYHYLLAGGSKEKLKEKIMKGEGMHIFDKKINFFASSIVGGCCSIAVGLALALKRKNSQKKVWCFIGDGAEDSGHFYEATRYVDGWDLPCIFVIEDNDRSVETPKRARYNKSETQWPKCVKRYYYKTTYPHAGIGRWVDFSGKKAGGSSF